MAKGYGGIRWHDVVSGLRWHGGGLSSRKWDGDTTERMDSLA